MSLRRRNSEKQQEFWIETVSVVKAPGHVFYERLNGPLTESGFEGFVEELVEPYYASGGRSWTPPGMYFRMLFVSYFEGIESQHTPIFNGLLSPP